MGYIVYLHLNKINGKAYVGITSKNPPTIRWGKNGYNYKENILFYRAIKKYGWDSFEHLILNEGLTLEEAQEKEKELILYYKDKKKSYNISDGYDAIGKGRHKRINVYTKEGKFINTYESIYQTSLIFNIPDTYICECANLYRDIRYIKEFIFLFDGDSIDERLDAIKEAAEKKKHFSKEHCQNISQARKGTKLSEETKKKIGDSRKGKPNIKNRVPIVMLSAEGNFIRKFDCVKDAAIYLGRASIANKIVDCCKTANGTILRKRILSVHGYRFIYESDFNKRVQV